MADQIRQRQGQGQADQKALPAGQGLGVARRIGLPGVEHFQFQLTTAAPRQLITAVQAFELLVGQIDQMIQGQALGEFAVLGTIGRADQAVELLPQVVFALLGLDLVKQALLGLPARIIALQLGADFALAFTQGLELAVKGEQLIIQILNTPLSDRAGLQCGQLLLGGTGQRLGIAQGLLQTLTQLLQGRTPRLIQQGGKISGLIIKRAGIEGDQPLLFGLLQTRLIILQTAGQSLTATGQLLLTTLHVFQLNLRLLQSRLRIGGFGQGRLIGQAQCIPTLLPERRLLHSSLQAMVQLAELAL